MIPFPKDMLTTKHEDSHSCTISTRAYNSQRFSEKGNKIEHFDAMLIVDVLCSSGDQESSLNNCSTSFSNINHFLSVLFFFLVMKFI